MDDGTDEIAAVLRVGEKVKVAALSVEQGTTTVGALRWGEA